MAEERKGLFVDGAWRTGGKALAVTHKYTGASLAEVATARPEDVAAAVEAARDAAVHPLGPAERSRVLAAVAQAVRAQAESLATLMAREGGKPKKDGLVEV